jgi:cytochrome c-type biogenesis protein
MSLDPSLVQDISILGYLIVFLGGLLTSLGPCNLATIPLIVGIVGGSHNLSRWRAFTLSFSYALGLAITFMLLGVVASLLGAWISGISSWWYYLVAAICFAIGLQMLGVLPFDLPMLFGGMRERIGLKGLPGALALGLVSGLVASQCATPVLAAVLTYVMAKGAVVYGASLLFVYALGRGVPIVLAGTFTGTLKRMQSLGKHSGLIEKASGIIVLAVGFYFLWIA